MKKKKKMSKEEELYEQLIVNMGPAYFDLMMPVPRNPGLKRVMKHYFPTMEDAEICTYLGIGNKGDRPGKTAAEISKESGKYDENEIMDRLEKLTLRGSVYKRERPGKPGVVEYSLGHFWEFGETLSVVDEHSPIGIEHREGMNKFYDWGAQQEWGRSKYPVWRTLIVDQPIDTEAKVLSWETASGIIKAQERICLAYCGCRVRHRNCNHRIDTCFIFAGFGDEIVESSKTIPGARVAQYITQEEALKRLDESLKEGLVPTTLNHADAPNSLFICMCCSCCCHILGTYARGYTGWGNPYALAKTNFKPEWDKEKCVLCGKCVELCEVKALWRHYPHKADHSDDFIFHEDDRCIGCGVCSFNCPTGAITMKKMRDAVPEPDFPSHLERVQKEARH